MPSTSVSLLLLISSCCFVLAAHAQSLEVTLLSSDGNVVSWESSGSGSGSGDDSAPTLLDVNPTSSKSNNNDSFPPFTTIIDTNVLNTNFDIDASSSGSGSGSGSGDDAAPILPTNNDNNFLPPFTIIDTNVLNTNNLNTNFDIDASSSGGGSGSGSGSGDDAAPVLPTNTFLPSFPTNVLNTNTLNTNFDTDASSSGGGSGSSSGDGSGDVAGFGMTPDQPTMLPTTTTTTATTTTTSEDPTDFNLVNHNIVTGNTGSGSGSGSGDGGDSGVTTPAPSTPNAITTTTADPPVAYTTTIAADDTTTTTAAATTTTTTTTTAAAATDTTTTEASTTVSVLPHTGYRSVGCYADLGNDRAMDMFAGVSNIMNPMICSAMCDKLGTFHFFGVEYGQECWCGNDPFRHGFADNCDMSCYGDDEFSCGGSFAMDVFAYTNGESPVTTTPSSQSTPPLLSKDYDGLAFEGCFIDDGKNRALPVKFVDFILMTPTYCASLCAEAGPEFQYIGLQYSVECFCGTTPFLYGLGAPGACSSPCSGDASLACGGSYVNSVYRITSSTTASPATTEPTTVEHSGSGESATPGGNPDHSDATALDGAHYEGCYADSSPRDFALGPFTSPQMTPILCHTLCSGYKFFGLQNGDQCYCGQTPFLYGASTTCNVPCHGDNFYTCGGAQANSIYGNCDQYGCGFSSQLEPFVNAFATQAAPASTVSAQTTSSNGVPGWAFGLIGGCVGAVLIALVALNFKRKRSSQKTAAIENMEEDELFTASIHDFSHPTNYRMTTLLEGEEDSHHLATETVA